MLSYYLPACRVQDLPHQDNHCDCGLFVLAYLHFFTAYPPSDVDGDKKDPKAAIGLDLELAIPRCLNGT